VALELRQKYAAQFEEQNFAALLTDVRARGGEVVAIYDDHDFLGNNRYGGDYGHVLRDAARAEFVTAFHPAMTGPDFYSDRRLGLVDIIVLDERFYRTSPMDAGGDRDAILGADQWNWLEQTLSANTEAKYTLVASGTTLHTFADESWEQYPGAFQQLVGLLSGRRGALVVSGDLHRNATYDDSGVRDRHLRSRTQRHRVRFAAQGLLYLLNFDEQKVHVDLRSLKVQWRYKFDIPLANWALP
jgi:hypothetical protein